MTDALGPLDFCHHCDTPLYHRGTFCLGCLAASTPAVPPAPTGPASGTAAGGSGAVESGPHGRALNPGDEHAPPGSVCPGSTLRYRRQLKGRK